MTDAPGLPQPRRIATNGIELSVHEAGPADGPAVVLCHGFPELAYSWRHQIPVLADAGYRVIAPDQRGYGASDAPDAIEAYDIHQLTADHAGLLDALGIERAVYVGHDWGGFVVWAMAQLQPDRVAGVIALNTPFQPRPPMDPIELMRAAFGEKFYIVQFQTPGHADAVLHEHVESVFRMFYAQRVAPTEDVSREEALSRSMLDAVAAFDPADAPPSILPEADLAHFTEVFRRTGFTGGVNWYRNFSRNWGLTEGSADHVAQPALMISAADDAVLPPELADGMEQFVPDLEKHVIPDCGHWTQQERPEETNRLLLDWLGRRFPT